MKIFIKHTVKTICDREIHIAQTNLESLPREFTDTLSDSQLLYFEDKLFNIDVYQEDTTGRVKLSIKDLYAFTFKDEYFLQISIEKVKAFVEKENNSYVLKIVYPKDCPEVKYNYPGYNNTLYEVPTYLLRNKE